jgi:hypothetical protein
MPQLPDTLTDRVQAQVEAAQRAIVRRTNATRPKVRRGQARPAEAVLPGSEPGQETESLQRVFRNMGILYRRHRKRTGGPVVPGLRDAAYNFRAEPSLGSLVVVAAFLDELELLH